MSLSMKSRATKSDQSSVSPVLYGDGEGTCHYTPVIVRDHNDVPMRMPLIRITLHPGSDIDILSPEMVLKETESPEHAGNVFLSFLSNGCYKYRNVSDESVTLIFKIVKYK